MSLLAANSAITKTVQVDPGTLGFEIPTFGELLTFLVKGFFVVAGIAALIMLLWGALAWVLSGGDKEKVEAARDRIIAAIIGVFMILFALAIVWTLEQIVFKGTICFGLSCPASIPVLVDPAGGSTGGSGGAGGTSGGAGSTGTSSGTSGKSGTSGNSSSGTVVVATSTPRPTPTGIRQLPGTGL